VAPRGCADGGRTVTDRLRVLEEQVAALTAQVDRLVAVAQAVQVTTAVIESLYRDAFARGQASTRPGEHDVRPLPRGSRRDRRGLHAVVPTTPGGTA